MVLFSVFAGLCVLLGAGLLQLFLQSPGMEIVIAAAGAILFSLFIIYDTHVSLTLMYLLVPEKPITFSTFRVGQCLLFKLIFFLETL